jgi:hypothetical protein
MIRQLLRKHSETLTEAGMMHSGSRVEFVAVMKDVLDLL